MHEAVAVPATERPVDTGSLGAAVFEVAMGARTRPESDPRGPGHEYYVVRRAVGEVAELVRNLGLVASMIERTSISTRRVLRQDGFEQADVDSGLDLGLFGYLRREEFLEQLDPARCGVGISGGGDCAGIADFIASLGSNLDDGTELLGVRNAGDGLSRSPQGFRDSLIVVDPLLIRDFEGQSSAPFGSARKDPLKNDQDAERTLANIGSFKFFYVTGGNDHGGLAERIAQRFPDKPVLWAPKTIDGDVSVGDKMVQALGFHSAVRRFQTEVLDVAQSAQTHSEVSVLEVFGRNCGRLAFEGARRDPEDFEKLDPEFRRKLLELGDTVMILVPERPTSLQALANEAMRIHKKERSCTVVVAEGFMPPELKSEMQRLARDGAFRDLWTRRELPIQNIYTLIQYDDEDDPRYVLAQMLTNRELAAKFGALIWEGTRDDYGNNIKLAGIRDFVIEAIKVLSDGKLKVNEEVENRELRGTAPTRYDQVMGQMLGGKMAELANSGVTGGKAVVYLEGMNPFEDDPVVLDLKDVGAKNNLNDTDRYDDDVLRSGGVFW